MKQLALITFLIIQFTTVFSQKDDDIILDVKRVNSDFIVDGMQMFYALPKNTIIIEVEVTKTIQYEGPYSTFAPKFLNITEGIIPIDSEWHTISSVKFTRNSQVDSTQFYSIIYNGYESLPMLQLNSSGILVGCNLSKSVKLKSAFNNPLVMPHIKIDDFSFIDLGEKPFLSKNEKTFYKTVETDSTPQRVAFTKTVLEPTTAEYNAKEAASFIRKIRKRRIKLVMGLKDEVVATDGKSIKLMLEELDKYEQQYLELFIGKSIKKTDTYYFDFIPNSNGDIQHQTIGWFSKKNGLSVKNPKSKSINYEALIITSKTVGNTPNIKIKNIDESQKTPVDIKYGLYYRIPGRIDISLQHGNKIIARQQHEIAQKGIVLPMPVEYLNGQKYSIEFYPETGALKGVILNKNE